MPDVEVVPVDGAPVGAEVCGVDLSRPLTADQVHAVKAALWERCVLVFRDQSLTDEQQVDFTRCFGTPVEHVRKQRERRVKEIFVISNVKENGEPIGALSELIDFHSDLSYLHSPGTLSLLYALEIPAEGGDTQFCDCRAAYDALPGELQERLRSLRAVHRHYVPEQNPPEPAVHPVMRRHPETGRWSLYVNPHLTSHIDALPRAEGDALLRDLYDQRRVMHRTQILCEEVVEA